MYPENAVIRWKVQIEIRRGSLRREFFSFVTFMTVENVCSHSNKCFKMILAFLFLWRYFVSFLLFLQIKISGFTYLFERLSRPSIMVCHHKLVVESVRYVFERLLYQS